jgi:hypothetical protein
LIFPSLHTKQIGVRSIPLWNLFKGDREQCIHSKKIRRDHGQQNTLIKMDVKPWIEKVETIVQ